MSTAAAPRPLLAALAGRWLIHPLLDISIIGGGLSLITVATLLLVPGGIEWTRASDLAWLVLLANSAHFASSTVRLYAKPGAFATWPFLTAAFPIVSLIVLVLCLAWASTLAPHLQALYLTWSPYHYAAQAYGLAVVYCLRSGCRLAALDKRLLWWTAMLPFFSNFLTSPNVGLHWLLPKAWLSAVPHLTVVLASAASALFLLAFAAPLLLLAKTGRAASGPMPLISILCVVTNGIWWFVLPPREAFVWATIFHGLQYLAIVTLFHVKDRVALEGNRRGPLAHALLFYMACIALGYGLFHLLPSAFMAMGSGPVESVLLVVAAINIHHFVVDAYIWRFKPSDPNARIVTSAAHAQVA